jgi:hypothetical protein
MIRSAIARRGLLGLVAAAFLLCGEARAHEGHAHILGTVTVVDATHLDLKTNDGATVEMRLTPKTSLLRRGQAAPLTDLKVGMRVLVDADHDETGLSAREIRFVVAPAN